MLCLPLLSTLLSLPFTSLPKAVESMVYKVVFVVPHHQQQLDGLRMTLCTEEDHHDLDFVGRVKVDRL